MSKIQLGLSVICNGRMASWLAVIALMLSLTSYYKVSAAPFINHKAYNINHTHRPARLCPMTIENSSVAYFQSRLEVYDLQFAHFSIKFNNGSINSSIMYNSTRETFRPNEWVWTYRTQSGLNPFLYWNIDYTILSFGLLAAKTLKSEPIIQFNVPDNCTITFGTTETTQAIANAIRDATYGIIKSGHAMPKYEVGYYCYLAEAPAARNSISYQAAVYFMYPISYINYNCCVVEYNYTIDHVTAECLKNQIEKWPQCTLGPYIIGVIMFLFYPILHFHICTWVANDETVEPAASMQVLQAHVQDNQENSGVETDDADAEWLYLDGNTPYAFTDILTHIWCGLKKKWPLVISRIRRLCVLLTMPVGLYVQITVYYYMFDNSVKLLVEHGTPLGFLSLLADPNDRANAFATVFGGPVGILILYFVISLLFIVVPRSVKQIYEDSIPPHIFCFKTPLALSLIDIKRLAMVNEPLEPGYQNVIFLLKGGIYMLFSKQFWKWVLKTQIERSYIIRNKSSSKMAYVFKFIRLPLYIVLCMLEILICIILYGLPICMWTVLIIRGAARSLIEFRRYLMQFCQSSFLRKVFLGNYLINGLAVLLLTCAVIIYVYVICLIFIGTFTFLSQVIVFCFVAVIVYPSVAFGYLFFFFVLIYYIIHRIREFGDGYLELLSDVVDISRNLDGQPNHITFYGDNMVISNVKAPRGIKGIQVNSTIIEVAANIFNDTQGRQKFKLAQNKCGIPKDLFDFLMKRHRPAHQQALKIVFHIMLIIVLIGLTINISNKYVTGPSSEISEVMHVVFIVVVGALPRILELALTNASASVKKEIELKTLEQSVLEYWDGVMGMD